MQYRMLLAAAVASALTASAAVAQAPCSTVRASADSARDDAMAVLTSASSLVKELRQEQAMTSDESLSQVSLVKERYVCARMAAAFDHIIAPGVKFVVLRIGPMYYARDPNQRVATGVFADSTFKVLMRLGPSMVTSAK